MISTIAAAIAVVFIFSNAVDQEVVKESHNERFREHYQIYALNMPDEVDFAGERAPLNLIDVKEKMDRELLVNTYWQSQTLLLIKRSHRWFPVIEKVLKEEGIPEDLKYLSLIESGFQQVVSPAGATGFWQLMKAAARENGLEVNSDIDERYHVEKSTRAACAYLKEAKERFGSWTLAAASYNMGKAGLARQLERQQATNYYDLVLNEETSRYVFRILAIKTILSEPSAFGFNLREEDLYQDLKYKTVTVDTTVADLAKFAFQHGINYKALKYLNPWLRDSSLPNASGRTYEIQIPTEPLADLLVNDKEQVATFTREKSDGHGNE